MEYRASDQAWPDFDEVTHFKFSATMQLRTPYCVLDRHGETYWDRSAPPPVFIQEPWQGTWTPQTDFSDRMAGISQMASEIGPIPSNGSDFHRFLLTIREVAERLDDPQERRTAIFDQCGRDIWADIITRLGGAGSVADRFYGEVKKV